MERSAGRSSPPIRLGLIGAGLAVEKLHWPALARLTDRFRVVAFADRSRAAAERFAAYSGTSMGAYHHDYGDLLRRDDVEAVLIALPIVLSLPATRDGLAAGKHVICEKPPGRDLAEGRLFLQMAARHPERKVLIAENFFYRDSLRLARSLVDGGAIGRPRLLSWRRVIHEPVRAGEFAGTPWRMAPEYVGGPHLDGGVHHIAQMRLLCGEVGQVYGATADADQPTSCTPDLALTLHFAGGALGSYAAGASAIPVPPEEDEMRLYGADATMLVGARHVRLHRADGAVEEHRLEGSDGGYYNELVNFHDAVVHGEPIIGDVAQSYQNMLVMLRGLESAADGRALPIEALPGAAGGAAVPCWRPRGADGLFDGLPVRVVTQARRA